MCNPPTSTSISSPISIPLRVLRHISPKNISQARTSPLSKIQKRRKATTAPEKNASTPSLNPQFPQAQPSAPITQGTSTPSLNPQFPQDWFTIPPVQVPALAALTDMPLQPSRPQAIADQSLMPRDFTSLSEDTLRNHLTATLSLVSLSRQSPVVHSDLVCLELMILMILLIQERSPMEPLPQWKRRQRQGGERKLILFLVLLNLFLAPPPFSLRGMPGLFSDAHFSPALFSSTQMPL